MAQKLDPKLIEAIGKENDELGPLDTAVKKWWEQRGYDPDSPYALIEGLCRGLGITDPQTKSMMSMMLQVGYYIAEKDAADNDYPDMGDFNWIKAD